MFARFSTVAGERGAADAERDIRGFALKFYTEEGNWDLVGNNTPVFFLRDPRKFPDLNKAVKRDPKTNMRSADQQLGLLDLAARGAAPGHHRDERPRHSLQLPPHARLRLARLQLRSTPPNERFWVKFHFTDAAGHPEPHRRRGLARWSAATARATSATCSTRIERGDFPKWTLYMQVMPEADADEGCPTTPSTSPRSGRRRTTR